MGPSYNNSFGSSGNSQAPIVPRTPVISSGGGDIILAPSNDGGAGKKKWLIVVVVVLFVVAVVTGVAAVIVGNRDDNGGTTSREANLHKLLEGKSVAVKSLVNSVQYMYSGMASLADFVLIPRGEIEQAIVIMNDGIVAMEGLQKELNVGMEVSGVRDGIDLSMNYEGLKNTLASDLGKYKSFVNLTTRLLLITQETNIQEDFASYDAMAISFADEVQKYWSDMARLNSIAPVNGSCTSGNATACYDAASEMVSLQESAKIANSIIVQMYKNNIGDFKYVGDGSLIEYFDGLYAGTEETNAN